MVVQPFVLLPLVLRGFTGPILFLEIAPEVFLFIKNPRISLESKTKRVIGTKQLKGSEFDHFSSKFDIKTTTKMDQIRAKMRLK